MTAPPLTVGPQSTIHDAANTMLVHKIGGLPVVEEGTLLGIITESDIFRMLVQDYTEPEGGQAERGE
jgi:CBS domain-containing protein